MEPVRKLFADGFYFEWAVLRKYGRPVYTGLTVPREARDRARTDFLNFERTWDTIFAFDAVQAVVEVDLSRYNEREKEVRDRYHRMSLRFFGRLYANELYLLTGGEVPQTVEQLRAGLKRMKVAWTCPMYPCDAQA